ncbi:CRISPR-associated endoribonuclease Cas6 [Kamptonema animale CS-326]|jgi:CRISPR-associated endoribonuclease Cas6|uniref:CRISPR-associated endoribonuclease Cas6 n=1 Tax=Kamptonema animale TaxID=92934 RepID=UPI00232C6D2B|nr:CRISPR-associated endoribonuclease Cas6 [Kamptonema animale]MDB9513328.1 CRISPR-associated endoribonuclease Cas6 [Kamptonema animale CS-326]
MPYSLVLNLLPSSPIPPQFLTGRHLHALFLKLVSAVDTDLSAYLHDQANEKAFTLSPLQVSKKEAQKIKIIGENKRIDPLGSRTLQWEYKQVIRGNTPIWWRISLLDDSLFARLTQLWLHLNFDRPWHLGPADLHITSILAVPQPAQPWVNAISYTQLYEHASAEERQIAFSFCTPTNFRQGQYDTPMPTRDTIFGSLLNRWNKYSNIPLDRTIIEPIFPSFFDIHTEMLADSRSKFIGCVGEVSYRIMGDVEPLKIKQINALADFALYSGVGRKTPMGMGMVRRLQELSNANGYRM